VEVLFVSSDKEAASCQQIKQVYN